MTSTLIVDDRDVDDRASVRVRIHQREARHGYLEDHDTLATLLVYEVAVSSQQSITEAIKRIDLECHIANYDGSEAPIIWDVAPHGMNLVHGEQTDVTAGTIGGTGPSVRWEAGEAPNTQRFAIIYGSSRQGLASWVLDVNKFSEPTSVVFPSFRIAVLLRRSSNKKFQCTFRIDIAKRLGGFFVSSSPKDVFVYDPSLHPSSSPNTLRIEDLRKSIDFQNDPDKPFVRDEPFDPDTGKAVEPTAEGSTSIPTITLTSGYQLPAEGEIAPQQGLIKATELPRPEKSVEWAKLSSYFQGTAAAESPSTDVAPRREADTPPHIWVINRHFDEITVVVSKGGGFKTLPDETTTPTYSLVGEVTFSETLFRGPAVRETLAPYTEDCEYSSAVFPLWPGDSGFGTISIFTGSDKKLYLEDEMVPAGARIYFDQKADRQQLKNQSAAQSRDSPLFPITINGWTLDPEVANHSSTESNYILIQSWMPLTSLQMKELEQMDLTFHDRRLFYVNYADIYPQEYKISGSLREVARSPRGDRSRIPHKVDIVFHDDVNLEKVGKEIAKIAHLRPETMQFCQHKVQQLIQEQHLSDIASLDEVRVIEKVYKSTGRSHVARGILRADAAWDPVDPLIQTFEGEGEVIAVADKGFDSGHISNHHRAFWHQDGQGSRVLSIYPLSNIPLVNDFDGHGTHVCGLAVGSGHAAIEGGIDIQGTAPRANLVVQCLGPDYDGVPKDLWQLFEMPYWKDRARVHSNSWGMTCGRHQHGYEDRAKRIDQFVWEHTDMVICWAAGNDNINPGTGHPLAQIGAEAAAKNCITVGATNNDVHDADQLFEDSSCGPTREGRIKPDVVAPGIRLLSANSAHKGHPEEPSDDPMWSYMTGTSMATPLVAGCAAVLREALRGQMDIWEPSAALIKALLVNGAVRLENRNQSGFGRVNLANSYAAARGTVDSGFREGIIEDANAWGQIDVPISNHNGPVTLKVTLVWSDYHGARLQNGLYLAVMVPGKPKRYGNDENDQRRMDKTNNVQQVEWKRIPPPKASIIIRAWKLDRGLQEFACVWRVIPTA
ncbi:hypothetical protein AYO20_07519 [Fonsecaea nubica]|uniref:Peptidase S8/S53 domain-containing protein n=1 Tax=Fonsecaea nubica TaxID=856822 RepID=A0A178CVJ1_9EURO|nr:hypothetical protein AYO20_07519 [Fonsecaea nubica]OAL33202.1 hypothetical protein AYO20_07519 [Fonsecaea nubica]